MTSLPQTHRYPPVFASLVLGLKTYANTSYSKLAHYILIQSHESSQDMGRMQPK